MMGLPKKKSEWNANRNGKRNETETKSRWIVRWGEKLHVSMHMYTQGNA